MADHRLRTRAVGHRPRSRARCTARGHRRRRRCRRRQGDGVGQGGGEGFDRRGRRRRRGRRAAPAGRGPRARPRHQRRLASRTRSAYTAPLAAAQLRAARGARRRDQARPRRHAGHHRVEPGLLDGGRPRLRRGSSARCRTRSTSRTTRTRPRRTWRGSVPRAHDLESWGDARAADGTRRRCSSRSSRRCSTALAGRAVVGLPRRRRPGGYKLVRAACATLDEGDSTRWQARVDGAASSTGRGAAADAGAAHAASADGAARAAAAPAGLEVNFVADRKVLDGRFANNVWLQELPDPITKLTWDNALVSLAGHGREAGRRRRRRSRRRSRPTGGAITAAGLASQPGHADDSVTIALGYGRDAAPEVRATASASTSTRSRHVRRAVVRARRHASRRPARRRQAAPSRRSTGRMEGRADRARVTNRAVMPKRPAHRRRRRRRADARCTSRTSTPATSGAMAIDLDKCTGCSACVVACSRREQHPRRRARAGASARARCTGCASTATSRARPTSPRACAAADDVRALREGAVRVRLPGQRDRALATKA